MTMKLTPFGKVVRKFRIDRGLTLKDMAEVLETSPVFLSAVETGRKNLTKKLLNSIIESFEFSDDERIALQRAGSETHKKIELNVEHQSGRKRELAAVFARSFPELADSNVDRLLEILKKAETPKRTK